MTDTLRDAAGCLDAETLAALIDGRLAPEARERALEHAATCPDCYEVYRDVVTTFPSQPADAPAPVVPLRPKTSRRWLAVGGGLAAAATIALALWLPRSIDPAGRSRPELTDLVAAVGTGRTVEGRLTGGFAWGVLDQTTRSATPTAVSPEVQIAAARLEQALGRERSASALAAFATSRLALGDVTGGVGALEEATTLEPRGAAYWSDLSSAYLAQAAEPGNEAGLPRALNAAETALSIDAALPEALFNKALALERLGMTSQAREAWTQYLAVPDASGWQAEARERLSRLNQPAATSPGAELLRQQLYGPLLRDWTDAPDTNARAEALTRIRAAAERLTTVVPDAVARDFVQSLEASARSPDTLPATVEAHRQFLLAQAAMPREDFQAAHTALAAAIPTLLAVNSPLAYTCQYNQVVIIYRLMNHLETERHLLALRERVAAKGYTTLTARVDSMLGLTSAMLGRHPESTARYEEAVRGFDAMADDPNSAHVRSLLAINYDSVGDPWRGWTMRVPALRESSRSGVFLTAALSAADRGWTRAALALSQQALTMARAADSPPNIADALRTQAALRAALDEPAAVARLVADARAMVERRREPAWDRVRAEIALAEAKAAGRDQAAAGIAAATAAITYFTRAEAAARLPELYAIRARLHEWSGAVPAARDDVRAGLARLATQRTSVAPGRDQVTFELMERELTARLVSLATTPAERDAAFAAVDASRGHDVAGRVRTLSIEDVASAVAPGTAFVEFVVGDTRASAWVITAERRSFVTFDVDRRRLTDLVKAVLPPRSDAASVAELSRLLVAPIAREAEGARLWVMVPDGPLWSLPFSLLTGPTSQPLAQDHALVATPSAASWLAATRRAAPAAERDTLLAIGNPTLDRLEYPDLPDLPQAAAEADDVAHRLGVPATVLRGVAATRDAVLTGLSHASVIHVAAHAVTNPWINDASYIALAGPAPSKLAAGDVRGLRLERARLVVLAACDTASGGQAALDNPLNLSRAFLAAGVANVIGSLWPVSDRATRELFTRFYDDYARTGDAVRALQRAQAALASSTDSTLSAPRQWAGFIVMGASPAHVRQISRGDS